jgi:protein-tyrosine phosphatase
MRRLRRRLALGTRLHAAVDAWTRLWYRLPPVRRQLSRRAQRAWARDTIAFVCLGNICRSPFAEGLANQQLNGGRRAVSAGYFPEAGRRSPEPAVAAAESLGVDLTPHRSRVLTEELIAGAGAIFVFDQQNYRTVLRAHPAAKGRVHFIGALSARGPLFVPDPYGASGRGYELAYRRIAELIADAQGSARSAGS